MRFLIYIATRPLLGYSLILVSITPVAAQKLTVNNLQCESRRDPAGVDQSKPTLSWQLHSSEQNVLQAAYRVLVADDPSYLEKNRGNIWDSKRILSRTSIQV